ncbi:oxidoreductase [Paenibacillus sp. SSG-1]|uniref:Oxidoreductase n=1 Tax=Paenibacillus cineris TaxID=237530 RepID=A0ABQ4L941_9BACL|nr:MULTISPECIES: bi-domain-containing oxidoreductase [Paenibacillus]OXL82662.1 oxidoreductase [Paenibacillus sp. SSG-1]GIO53022.1 oxidoreductase [Paenibacillus cineris]
MNQVLIRQGAAVVENIPEPVVLKGTVLVRVDHSCISSGTEISGLRSSGVPLWKRAVQQPDKVKKVMRMVAAQGISRTRALLQVKVGTAEPTGYSAAGTVIEVGEEVTDIRPGDRVACAGAQFAHHAEVIRVPRNLVVPVPDGLDLAEASTVTLGAIAMQGVRRAQPTLGETFVVIGLGILGQLTVQFLKTNGCRVIGTDLDPGRITLARQLGMDDAIDPSGGSAMDVVHRLTDGIGADGVIITAAAKSNTILSEAFKMTRKKGRVVVVGDVGLHINRADIYEKELDFYISTSYGPGRYDYNYEEKGRDYPVGYVRWTENRNMGEYLKLLAEERVNVKPLISRVYRLDEAPEAYAYIQQNTKPMMVLLSYPQSAAGMKPIHKVIIQPEVQPPKRKQVRIRVGLVGAGDFAKTMHLPNLKSLSDQFTLQAVMSQTGHNAAATARQFGAVYAATSLPVILEDPDIDAVLITTRHDTHGPMVLDALMAGKHVFVEKPLALTADELLFIKQFYQEHEEAGQSAPLLMTGFNRRFSKYGSRIKEIVHDRSNPMIINYRMNAGYLPLDHWTQTEEGGGRNLGECCHIYDLFTYLTGSRVIDTQVNHLKPATNYYSHTDNFVATFHFADGSVASVTYTSLGSKEYAKEQMDIYVDGKNIFLDDYRKLVVAGSRAKGLETKISDKGQREALERFAHAIQKGGTWPIPLWQQVQATDMALEVEGFLTGGMNSQWG